ncbi:MAG: LicD family protein [Prevotella sp.]|nr:LicD family protein [Prevotella sp.]
MRQITSIEELRGIQLDILDNIHHFCQQHKLSYFLSSGTLLGAVRHGGFIPWDDDIDIYMPRADYERFLATYTAENYRVVSPEKDRNYYFSFAKVIDKRTKMLQEGIRGMEFGVFVDIFPVDFVPEDEAERQRVFKRKHLLFKIRRCKVAKSNPLDSRLAWMFYRFLPISMAALQRCIDKLIVKTEPTSLVCNMTDGGPGIKSCFSAEAIASSVDIDFEGHTYKTMVGFREYLTKTYGDYMTPPPVDKRESHHFIAFWI